MKFSEEVDKSEVKAEHEFEYDFSKNYIKNKNILNIGSWTGPYEVLATQATKKITAVDIDERPLKVLKKNLPQVDVVVASSHSLPFQDKSFDAVTLWAVIEHIPIGYELASLKEINRVTKKGGYIFLTTMNWNFWSNLLDPGFWLTGHRHYTKSQLQQMLVDAGFKLEKVEITGGFFTAFHAWVFYFFKYILRIDLPKISIIENKFKKDFYTKGFYQIAIRAKKI